MKKPQVKNMKGYVVYYNPKNKIGAGVLINTGVFQVCSSKLMAMTKIADVNEAFRSSIEVLPCLITFTIKN